MLTPLLSSENLVILMAGMLGFFAGILINHIINQFYKYIHIKSNQRGFRLSASNYVFIKLLTTFGFILAYLQFGMTWKMFFEITFLCLIICLFFIDLETYYLPDAMTFSLLLLGFIGSSFGILKLSMSEAVMGAIFGYALPYVINYIYSIWRRCNGIGGGDLKLMAAFGAWFGVAAVLPILVIASFLALLCIGIFMVFGKKTVGLNHVIPFGPYLILAVAVLYLDLYLFRLFSI